MYKVLICDDDKDIVEALSVYLKTEGYEIIKAYNGKEAINALDETAVHLILLDIMMPELNGIQTTMKLRQANNSIPIIFLTAKSEDYDKILGLNVGADDYITKPFNPLELIARVKASLRRYTTLGSLALPDKENIYSSGGLIINDESKEVSVDGEPVRLTPIEYNLLKLLVRNKGRVYSISEIYELIWKEDSYGVDNIVAVHIRHIREKIEINPREPKYLKVVWGIGYKIENIS